MKTRVLFMLAVITALTGFRANAKIWRVNNNGYSADFAQLQNANDNNNVLNGDTIHLEGSSVTYNSAQISKRLIIIGSGYFLTSNPNTSANKLQTKISYINFNDGSSGSQLISIYVGGTSFGININTSNITIKRCLIDYGIYLGYAISNIKILNNYFLNAGSNIISTTSFGFPTDAVFNNNICLKGIKINDPNYVFAECNNNIFDVPTASPAIQLYAGTFYNNILTNPNATVSINGGDFTYVDYNISASANNQFGTSKHNIVADSSTLFIGGTSRDGKYQIKAGSAADNSGSDGTDRGVFGGGAPQNWYTLSGLAPIPVIYSIKSTGVGSGSLPITIQARTIK